MRRRSMRVDAKRQNLQNILFNKSSSRTTIIPESPMVTSMANCSEKMSILETPDTVSKNCSLMRILEVDETSDTNCSEIFSHTPDIICHKKKANMKTKLSLGSETTGNGAIKSTRSISPSKLIFPFDVNDEEEISKKLNNCEVVLPSPRNVKRRETRSPVFRRSIDQATCNRRDITIKNKVSKAIESLNLSNQSIPTSPDIYSELIVQRKTQTSSSIFEFPKSPKVYCNSSHLNIADTQPATSLILDGIVAYVDVRTGNDNRSLAMGEFAKSIGADIAAKFTSNVTHLIFKEGSNSTFERATQRGIHLVSTLWLNACHKEQRRVPESLYPAISNSKDAVMQVRYRKPKSMQPLSFEEQEELADARMKKRMKTSKCSSVSDEFNSTTPLRVRELQHASSKDALKDFLSPKSGRKSCSATDDSMDSDEELNTPLRERMFQKMFRKRTPLSSLTVTPENRQSGRVKIGHVADMELEHGGKSLSSSIKENSPIGCRKLVIGDSSRRKSKRLAKLSQVRCNGSSLFSTSSLKLNESSVNDHINSVNYEHKDMDLTDEENSVFISDSQNPKINTQTLSNIVQPNAVEMRKNPHRRSIIRCRYDIDSQCTTNSVGSSISVPKMHRLHTVDIDQPTQDLIYPNTPDSPEKIPSTLYDSLLEKKSQVSSKLVKNGPKVKKKKLGRISPRKGKDPSTSNSIVHNLPQSNVDHLTLTADHAMDTSDSSRQTSDLRFNSPPNKIAAASRKSRSRKVSMLPKSRQSLDEFMPRKKVDRLSCVIKPDEKSASICFTSVKSCDIPNLMAIVHKLKGYRIVKSVNTTTTHVVCGSERRTLNVLRGITKGCWIVDVSWLFESLELEQWAPEEPFELFNFCPGAKISRIAKSTESHDDKGILCDVGSICISGTTDPPAADLKVILKNLGAIVTTTTQHAHLIIGRKLSNRNPSALYVHEKWLLDCIQHWKAFPPHKYLIQE